MTDERNKASIADFPFDDRPFSQLPEGLRHLIITGEPETLAVAVDRVAEQDPFNRDLMSVFLALAITKLSTARDESKKRLLEAVRSSAERSFYRDEDASQLSPRVV